MRNAGFTLVEIIVVVGIIVLSALLIFPNWNKGQRGLGLERSAHFFEQEVRNTIELALRAEQLPSGVTCPIGRNITGYGIYITASTPEKFSLFADCRLDGTGSVREYSALEDVVVKEFTLEEGISFQSTAPSPFSVVFEPPTPEVGINPGNVAQGSVILQITDDISETRTVQVNNKGVVEIQ